MTSSTDVSVLIDRIVKLDRQVGQLEEKFSQSTDKNTLLMEENIRLQTENAGLRAENIRLEVRIGELEHRLNKTSRNSSKPPSSDGFAKLRVKARDGKSGRSSGGQFGYRGQTLKRSSAVDFIVNHRPSARLRAGAPKTGPGELRPRTGKTFGSHPMKLVGFHAFANQHTGSIAHPMREGQQKRPSCARPQRIHTQCQAKSSVGSSCPESS